MMSVKVKNNANKYLRIGVCQVAQEVVIICILLADNSSINCNHIAYSRGINPGEHIVNLHLYREDISAFDPFEANVVVTVVNPTTKVRQQLLESSVLLDEIGKELTIFRFELQEDGNLNKESLNNKFVQLRSGSK